MEQSPPPRSTSTPPSAAASNSEADAGASARFSQLIRWDAFREWLRGTSLLLCLPGIALVVWGAALMLAPQLSYLFLGLVGISFGVWFVVVVSRLARLLRSIESVTKNVVAQVHLAARPAVSNFDQSDPSEISKKILFH